MIRNKNGVLLSMARLLDHNRSKILDANKQDLSEFSKDDKAMYDRLSVNANKIDNMIVAAERVAAQEDPIGRVLYSFKHDNGMRVENRAAPFGRILIIYESRPDVTVEAAAIAFKSGNRIKLKGGKESIHSNLLLVDLWHQALAENDYTTDWIEYLSLSRVETQAYLRNPKEKIDLVVPRGGEGLIKFVKEHASCPVIVSGRGNNFVYVDASAKPEMVKSLITNAKVSKISACNALDKVLVHQTQVASGLLATIDKELQQKGVEVLKCNSEPSEYPSDLWEEEFLEMKILMSPVENMEAAINLINQYSGGHSATIITEDSLMADHFMQEVDVAAVYHNVSTRFTDGGQFGMGAELAISTDKLHHRGPLGIDELVTNKWYIHGEGQIR